jgi:hypothetical protein
MQETGLHLHHFNTDDTTVSNLSQSYTLTDKKSCPGQPAPVEPIPRTNGTTVDPMVKLSMYRHASSSFNIAVTPQPPALLPLSATQSLFQVSRLLFYTRVYCIWNYHACLAVYGWHYISYAALDCDAPKQRLSSAGRSHHAHHWLVWCVPRRGAYHHHDRTSPPPASSDTAVCFWRRS